MIKRGTKNKNMLRFIIYLFLPLFIFLGNCWAQDENLKNIVRKELNNPVLVGKSELSVLLSKIYDIYLWAESNEWSRQKPSVLCRVYDREITQDRLMRFTLKEMKRIHGLSSKVVDKYREQLSPILPGVKEGDSICLAFHPGQGMKYLHNGQSRGIIPESDLSQHFQDIWLHSQTRYPQMREELLNSNKEASAQFKSKDNPVPGMN